MGESGIICLKIKSEDPKLLNGRRLHYFNSASPPPLRPPNSESPLLVPFRPFKEILAVAHGL